MLKKIYLPNDEYSLKEYNVNYSEEKVIKFINDKSIELGGEVKDFFSPLLHPYVEVKSNERMSIETNKSWGISHHDFYNGISYPDYTEYDIAKIFINEEPIIKLLVDTSNFTKNHLRLFLDKKTLFEYIFNFQNTRKYDKEFFEKNFIEMLSLKDLYKYLYKNKNQLQIIRDFLNLFRFENEQIISYDEIETFLKKNIYHTACFGLYSFQKQFLEYSKKEFERTKTISKANEKVLKLIK